MQETESLLDSGCRLDPWEDALEKGMATHSSILAWRIPWTEEAGGIQSMGLQRAGHKIMVRESDNVLIFLTMAGVNFLKHLI